MSLQYVHFLVLDFSEKPFINTDLQRHYLYEKNVSTKCVFSKKNVFFITITANCIKRTFFITGMNAKNALTILNFN